MSDQGMEWELIPIPGQGIDTTPEGKGVVSRLLGYANRLPAENPYGEGTGIGPQDTPAPARRLGDLIRGDPKAPGGELRQRLGDFAEGAENFTPWESGYHLGGSLAKLDPVGAAVNALGALPDGGSAFAHLAPAMLLGPTARGIDTKALGLAKEATALSQTHPHLTGPAGLDKGAILQGTGWWQGPEGGWRTEIGDKFASIPDPDQNIPAKGMPLRDYFNHPELFRAYPELHDVTLKPISLAEHQQGVKGAYQPIGKPGETFNPPTFYVNQRLSPEQQKSTLLHEIGHLIQDKEGWELGGNSSIAVPNYDSEDVRALYRARDLVQATTQNKPPGWIDTPEGEPTKRLIANYNHSIDRAARYNGYRGIYGEMESRAIQKRMDYTDEQRAAKPFENDFDIPEKGRQSAGIGAPWADHPTYIPDPLERVISGDPKQLEPGWGSAGKNDVERARWLLETGALGEHYREWKTAANEFGKANAAGNKPHTNFWGGVMDDIHQQIGDQGMDKMERSLDLPHPDVTKRWYQTEKALTRTRIDSASDIGTSLKYSNELTGLLGKNFSDLGHQDKNTLAKVEYALQQHGPEVLKPWSDMHIKDILSPEDYKDYYRAKYFGDKDPANFAPYEQKALDTTLANHQALIEQAKAHYAERAQRHFNLTPVGP